MTKSYTETELLANYELFINSLPKYFSGDRLEKLKKLYSEEEFGYRLTTAPASAKEHFHNAYPGGYLDHINNVLVTSFGVKKLYEFRGGTIDFTDEELAFSAIHHDLGKLGDKEQGEYYLPQDSEWHRKNKSEIYKFNSQLQYMDVTDRALFILQQYQIVCTWKETLAIKLSDGLYHEPNTSYLKSYNPDHELKTNLPRVLHIGDYMACRCEYDQWKLDNE
jgi:hypothetical protein